MASIERCFGTEYFGFSESSALRAAHCAVSIALQQYFSMNGKFLNTQSGFLDTVVNDITDLNGTESAETGTREVNDCYVLAGSVEV